MKNRSTQSDTNLDFDGMAQTGTDRVNQKMMTNQWSGHMNDGRLVNFGRGPTKGNMGCGKPGQPGATKSVTMDTYRDTPNTKTVPSTKINADSINIGSQVRNPSGTRAWDPKAGQNYSGNPDKIRAGQTGGPAYGKTTKGSRPSTAAGQVDFNYGPGKQY